MLEYIVKQFKHGIIDEVESQSIPDGAASASLNWQTMGDKIELRRGSKLMGSDAGTGRVSGIGKSVRQDGTEVLFRSRGRKIEYYDETTDDWVEIGTNTLPAAADGEDISFSPYNGLSGSQMFLSSENSSIYKIMTANPGSITDLLSTDHKGKIKIRTGRMYLWGRKGTNGIKDETGLYRSKIDKDEVSDFTEVTNESLGVSGSLTYSGTLAFKAGGAKRTCFLVRIDDTSETFTDNKNGVLVGSAGGTGTINYTTGAYSVTFASAAVGAVTADYYWEDSTSGGIADFAYSATRTAGQGYVLRQDDGGGALQNIPFYNGEAYCFHRKKTWKVSESLDDLELTNLIYRELVGIPYFRAQAETGEGIYYVDDNDKRIRLLTFDNAGLQVKPVPISNNLNLEDYEFDKAVGFAFLDWILFACRTSDSTVNNRVIVYDRQLKSLDILDYFVSCFEIYNGALVAGDSMSNNVYELFSGFDDADAEIPNSWEGNLTNLQIEELKKTKKLRLQGEIAPDQSYNVYLSLDRGGYVLIGTVDGTGDYVDRTSRALVGTSVLGKNTIGGSNNGAVVAYNYFTQLSVRQDKFYEAKIKFEATGLGYVSVSMYSFFDILKRGQKLPRKYR